MIFTEAIYEVRESHNCAWTFETHFITKISNPVLEVQDRNLTESRQQPFYIRREWNHFLQRFSCALLERKTLDEPILSLQRNVFFRKRDEAKLRDAKVLELLYEEAKFNILTGRYPCEISDYIMLGGIQVGSSPRFL